MAIFTKFFAELQKSVGATTPTFLRKNRQALKRTGNYREELGTLAEKLREFRKLLREFRQKSGTLEKLLREFWAKLTE